MRAWFGWTVGEALTRTTTRTMQKVVGVLDTTVAGGVLATTVGGLVQMLVGLIGTAMKRGPFVTSKKDIIGACAFGVLAYGATVVGFYIFTVGGDLGVSTLIFTLSIIPGGLIDRLWFDRKLDSKQWLAIVVAIAAGYCVLGLPSLQALLQMPLWVVLSFAAMLMIAVNQGVSQWIKDIDPLLKNYWGGLTQLVLGVGTLTLFGLPDLVGNIFWALIAYSALIGFINVGLWFFNVLSYRYGANIAIKNILMNGVYLSTAMLSGIFFFDEPGGWEKFAGVGLYLVAISLWNKK